VVTARGKALEAITAVLEAGAYSNLALKQATKNVSSTDAALIKQLVYGTLTYRASLDYLLSQWLTRPLAKLQPAIRNVLRLGLYQIIYLQVPDHAAVDESVRLAHRVGHKGVAGLVNAVLRRAVRCKDDLPWPQTESATYNLSVRYSFPEWMIARWLERYGTEETRALCQAHNQVPGIDLRVNTLLNTQAELLAELEAEGLEAEANRWVKNSVHLTAASLPHLSALAKGRCTVQGAASTLVGQVVDPQPGQLVYDVCAAPGGKALHMAELMQNTGQVVALDIHSRRLGLIEKAAKRLQINSVNTRCIDATKLAEQGWEPADCVLVDAPCSGLGVIRRKPDIRWQRQPADIRQLSALQIKILQQAASLVKVGGVLVYSVCSTEPEESSEIVDAFLQQQPAFEPLPWPEPLQAVWGAELEAGTLTTHPHRHGLDGFFIARLGRRR